MKQSNDFMIDIADFDLHPDALLWRAGSPHSVRIEDGLAIVEVPYHAFSLQGSLKPCEDISSDVRNLSIECLGDEILHVYTHHTDSPMLEMQDDLIRNPLTVEELENKWQIRDRDGRMRAQIEKKRSTPEGWSDLIGPAFDTLRGSFFPSQSSQPVSLAGEDQFFPEKVESLPLAFVTWLDKEEEKTASLFAFESDYNEQFVGTGERFAGMNLSGRTFVLENTDGLGVNSRRAYKNVPFFLSSKGFGVFAHTSRHLRLSLGDVSTRAVQGRIEDNRIDLFLIGGGSPEPVLRNYRRLTGFPPELPLWSYGTWMSRMTYFSATEIEDICDRLRDEEYPCDVIHIDTGWFEKDWVCEWTFSSERFPKPAQFMANLRNQGYRVSLWQTPNIGEGNRLLEEAREKRYLAPPDKNRKSSSSDFSGQDFGGQIDFTNPEAVDWYRSMIQSLLADGASVIKTDFGENIQMNADYMNLSPEELHNLYGLLYQKAAFEETEETTGEGIVWARAGWAGCQRYPLHWGGDAASSWDGMAGSLRGGLHLGLSGFGFWSHDVPGFHGLPEFMNSTPSNELYMRWTQFGVFSSHLRYHGTSSREPWYFPEIKSLIRQWLRLRYYFIPYFLEQAAEVARSGHPFLRAMLLHFPDDPVCWQIDDQFFCGDGILVCPVINPENKRRIYLPEGEWRDFWSGETISGPIWIERENIPLEILPVFCRDGLSIPVYPEPVLSTDSMNPENSVTLEINDDFQGWLTHPHAEVLGWR